MPEWFEEEPNKSYEQKNEIGKYATSQYNYI